MALDTRELKELVSILQMDTQPFQAILESLKNFTRVEGAGGGRLCLALNCMVHDNYYHASDASSASELLITAFILHSISTQSQRNGKPPPHTKSSLYGILQLIERDLRIKQSAYDEQGVNEQLCLKVFVLECLSEREELLACTPRQVLEEDPSAVIARHNVLQRNSSLIETLQAAQKAAEEGPSGALSRHGVTPVLVPADYNNVDTGPVEGEWSYSGKSLETRFEPFCERPPPPPLGVSEQELSWLYTEGYSADLIWDTTMASTPDDSLELRDSVQKALKQNLPAEEQQALKQKLSQNQGALLRVGVSPYRLPALVERNAPIAVHFLTYLIRDHMRTAEEYLAALVHMNPCLGSCSVMGELIKLPGLPLNCPREFILSALSFLKRGADNRRIGIVSAFCLLVARETDPASPKGRILASSRDLVAQLTQFATENASVSEAQALFKALRERSDSNAGDEKDEE